MIRYFGDRQTVVAQHLVGDKDFYLMDVVDGRLIQYLSENFGDVIGRPLYMIGQIG
ncbi:hypothetical protein D3C87_2207540 [compost metagenome]